MSAVLFNGLPNQMGLIAAALLGVTAGVVAEKISPSAHYAAVVQANTRPEQTISRPSPAPDRLTEFNEGEKGQRV